MKKIAIGVLAIAILHSILFYGQEFGVSVVLFTIPLLALIIYALVSKKKAKNKMAFWLTVPITLLSSTYAIFNNTFLNFVNFIAIIVLTCIMIIWAVYDKFNFSDAFVRVFVIIFKPFGHIIEGIKVFVNSVLKNKNNGEIKIQESKVFKQIFIGLIISLPLLLIIIALLISADSIFAEYLAPIKNVINSIVNINFISSIYFRAILVILIVIYSMAFMCSMLKLNINKKEKNNKGIKLQNITLNTVLTMLNIVYFLFSIVQFTHLFTQALVNSEFDYASYARRGFFQLMIVTFINFVIITITNLNRRETTTLVSVYTKIMNVLLICFTVILNISAVIRMHMYEQEYGYTVLRLTVYFILITEIILAIPTLIYVFSKKFSVLKWYVSIGAIMLVLFNFINVDRTIARNNISKYIKDINIKGVENAKIDVKYLTNNLSIDAVPELERLYNNTSDSDVQKTIEGYFTLRYYTVPKKNRSSFARRKFEKVKEEKDFQEFNLCEYQAKQILQRYISVKINKE